jgi:hypothetical protein
MTVDVSYLTDDPGPADPVTGAVNGVYTQNTEHAAEAVSHLIQFFREGPRNQAVLESVMAQVQEVEDALWYMRNAFDVNTAVGEQLEFLGRRVGEGRQDRTDAQYRAAIRVRILVNMSEGTLPELLAICVGINPTGTYIARDLYPAAMSIEADTFDATSLAAAYRLLRAAKTCGVRLNLIAGGDDASIGDTDADPLGGLIGSVGDAPYAGFVMADGT